MLNKSPVVKLVNRSGDSTLKISYFSTSTDKQVQHVLFKARVPYFAYSRNLHNDPTHVTITNSTGTQLLTFSLASIKSSTTVEILKDKSGKLTHKNVVQLKSVTSSGNSSDNSSIWIILILIALAIYFFYSKKNIRKH